MKKLNLLILLSFISLFINAQKYSFEDNNVICRVKLSNHKNDSFIVEIILKNKTKKSIFLFQHNEEEITTSDSVMNLNICWDQLNVENVLVQLTELKSDTFYNKKFMFSNSDIQKINSVLMQLNYALSEEIKDKILEKNKIYLNDYFIKMKWHEFYWNLH